MTTWALPTGRHDLLLTVQGDATITPTEGDPVTAAPAQAVHIPPQASSAPLAVHPGPTPWQAIVITYPTPNDHTHTWQQRWEEIRGDLLQEHLGLTRTHHTLHPVRGVGQAPHGILTPGLWAYATPINPQAAEDIKTALSIQQAQTQTPHRNTQRGYTIWWAYQDHDTLTPQPGPPSLDTNTTALLQAAAAAATQVGALEIWSSQYLVETKVAPHAKAQEKPPTLYGVLLVVSATGDEDVGGCQLIHLCGVGEVAGDGDLGRVLLAGGGVGDDVVGHPFVLGGVFRRVQLEWGVERLR